MIWYHGTTLEAALSILRTGFRVGSWFARDRADAVAFGGPVVLSVDLDAERLGPDVTWQCHTLITIGPERITRIDTLSHPT